MKSLVLRVSIFVLFVVGLTIALGQNLATAQPKADSQLYMPLVSLMPTPTLTPTATPTVLPVRTLVDVGPFPSSQTGGSPFRDNPPDSGNVTQVQVYYGSGAGVYAVQMVLSTGPLGWHGKQQGALATTTLDPGEYITKINGRGFAIIDQISFVTNTGRTIGPYGGSGGGPFSLSADAGYEIVGFFGRSGLAIDQIGGLARVRR